RFFTAGASLLSNPPRAVSIFVCAMLPFLASSTNRSTISGRASATFARVKVLQCFGLGAPPPHFFVTGASPSKPSRTNLPATRFRSIHSLQKQTGEQPPGALPSSSLLLFQNSSLNLTKFHFSLNFYL